MWSAVQLPDDNDGCGGIVCWPKRGRGEIHFIASLAVVILNVILLLLGCTTPNSDQHSVPVVFYPRHTLALAMDDYTSWYSGY